MKAVAGVVGTTLNFIQDSLNVGNTSGLSPGEKAGYFLLAIFIGVLAAASIGITWLTERRRKVGAP